MGSLINICILHPYKNKHMELIYFILGFLFTITCYGIVLFHKTSSSHKVLLSDLNSYEETSSKEFDGILDQFYVLEKHIEEISEYYSQIQKQMKNDAYEGNTKLNDRITELAELFNEQGNKNKRLFDVADKQLIQNQRDIQQANSTLKKIVDDPTILARY